MLTLTEKRGKARFALVYPHLLCRKTNALVLLLSAFQGIDEKERKAFQMLRSFRKQ